MKKYFVIFVALFVALSIVGFSFATEEPVTNSQSQQEEVEKDKDKKDDDKQVEEPKKENEGESKEEVQEEQKEEQKEEVKEEVKEEQKEETKEEIKEEQKSEQKSEPKSVEVPVEKVIVTLKARGGNGSYTTVQTWHAVRGGSNTWANADKSAQKYSPAEYNGTVYIYTGEWKDEFGNTYTIGERKQGADFIALFDGQEGPTATLVVEAQYETEEVINLTVNYNDNVANGSGSWSNIDGADNYSHTFKEPADIPEHYEFLYWLGDNGEKFKAEETLSVNIKELDSDTTMNFTAVYEYQPPIELSYHYNGNVKTDLYYEDVSIYNNAPEDYYWFYNGEEDPIPEDEIIELPQKVVTDKKIEDTKKVDVYAKFFVITWVNDDDSELWVDENVPYGAMPIYGGETPTKESDGKYEYTFIGWDKEISIAVENETYKAVYEAKVIVIPTEPTNPTEPSEPTEPTNPTQPTQPTEPTEPTNPTEPTQPTDPTDPTDPTKPTNSTEPTKHTKSTNETQTTNPTNQTTTTPEITSYFVDEDFFIETERTKPTTEINRGIIPTTSTQEYWALVNLITVIINFILAFILLILAFWNTRKEDEEVTVKNHWWVRIATFIVGIISAIIFMITENTNNPWTLIDQWTLLMVIITVIEIILLIFAKHKEENSEE